MRCDACGDREAVVALTQIVNEVVSTLHLCEKCAAERGVESPGAGPKTPLGSFLAAMGKGAQAGGAAPGTCPGCGATLRDFRETGRLGCASCYDVFERPLRDLLRRVHGSVVHVGERYAAPGAPQPAAEAAPPAPDVEALREALRRAVEAEEFERAAELRDRLRGLE